MILAALMLALVAQPEPTPATPAYSHLRCEGVESFLVDDSSSATVTDAAGQAHTATVGHSVRESRASTVRFDFTGKGRVETSSGWHDLASLNIGPDAITGTYNRNYGVAVVFNPFLLAKKPSFHVDRINGRGELSFWGGSFQGACKPETAERAF